MDLTYFNACCNTSDCAVLLKMYELNIITLSDIIKTMYLQDCKKLTKIHKDIHNMLECNREFSYLDNPYIVYTCLKMESYRNDLDYIKYVLNTSNINLNTLKIGKINKNTFYFNALNDMDALNYMNLKMNDECEEFIKNYDNNKKTKHQLDILKLVNSDSKFEILHLYEIKLITVEDIIETDFFDKYDNLHVTTLHYDLEKLICSSKFDINAYNIKSDYIVYVCAIKYLNHSATILKHLVAKYNFDILNIQIGDLKCKCPYLEINQQKIKDINYNHNDLNLTYYITNEEVKKYVEELSNVKHLFKKIIPTLTKEEKEQLIKELLK